jgi:hypothetical protein
LPIGNCPREGTANGGQESGITRLRYLLSTEFESGE